ncbi:restriction endonuclease subunit S [Methanobacterium formicicum]|nr:restriction endonuclease subunit S [Methanobacterium formicicum]
METKKIVENSKERVIGDYNKIKGPYTLPTDWKWVKLGDETISHINPKKTEVRDILDENIEVSFVPMENIDGITGQIIQLDLKNIADVYKGYTYFRDGDIIFAKITPCMENGKCVIVNNLKNGIGFGSTEFHVIRLKKNINKKWIWYLLRFLETRENAKKQFTGAVGHKRVPVDFLKELLVPLPYNGGIPDLKKQNKLVEKIDSIFDEISVMERLREKAVLNTDMLFETILNDFFKKYDNDPDWKFIELGNKDISKKIMSGGTPSRKISDYWNDGTINWVKISDITENQFYINETDEKITENGLNNSSAKLFDEETVLFSIFASIGKVGILKIPAATNQAIVGIKPNENINNEFLAYLLKYKARKLLNKGRGNAQSNINQSILKKFAFPIPYKDNKPDLKKQNEIVNYLNQFNKVLQKLNNLQELQLEKFIYLKENVLKNAFKGNYDDQRSRNKN